MTYLPGLRDVLQVIQSPNLLFGLPRLLVAGCIASCWNPSSCMDHAASEYRLKDRERVLQ